MNNPLSEVVLPIADEGTGWKLFTYSWKSIEGNKYAGYLYAKDFYHATILLEDMKTTASIEGEMING